MKVKLNELVEPTAIGYPYVRGGVSQKHVDDLAVSLIDGLAHNGKVPFTEKFIGMRLPQPVKGEGDPKLIKAWEAGARIVVLNGVHRIRAIRKVSGEVRPSAVNGIAKDDLPIESIDMDVRDPMPASKIKIVQLQADMENGLPITTEQRESTIKSLVVDDKMPQSEVGKLFHLSQASVSRIASGKQTMKQLGLEKAGGRKAKKGRKKSKKGKKSWDAYQFLDMAIEYGATAKKHDEKIVAALATPGGKKLAKGLRIVADLFTTYADLAEKPVVETAPPVAATA